MSSRPPADGVRAASLLAAPRSDPCSWPPWPAMGGAGAPGTAIAHSPVQCPADGALQDAQHAAGATFVSAAAAILPTWPATPLLAQIRLVRLGQVQLAAERMSQLRPSARHAERLATELVILAFA